MGAIVVRLPCLLQEMAHETVGLGVILVPPLNQACMQFSSFPSLFVCIYIHCLLLASPAIPDHHTSASGLPHPHLNSPFLAANIHHTST